MLAVLDHPGIVYSRDHLEAMNEYADKKNWNLLHLQL